MVLMAFLLMLSIHARNTLLGMTKCPRVDGSSSRCHGVVCSLWLWYFLIILTYYFCLGDQKVPIWCIINKEVLGNSYNRSRRTFIHFCILVFSTLFIKFTCTKYMLEVVPGSPNTGTVISRGLQLWEVKEFVFPVSCCMGAALKEKM